MNKLNELQAIVKRSWDQAVNDPDIRRWNSLSVLAGCGSVQAELEYGDTFAAASLEGIAEESRRRALAMQPQRVAA